MIGLTTRAHREMCNGCGRRIGEELKSSGYAGPAFRRAQHVTKTLVC